MNARANHILLVALVAILAVISVMTLPRISLRMIAGLLLVYYLPGHAILRAMNAERRNDLVEVVFAGGLSIAVTIFCGLVLNLVGPLTPTRWAIALGAVTLAACAVAYARGRRLPVAPRPPMRVPALRVRQAAMLGLSGLIVAATALWTRNDLLAHPEFAYTELWMTPDAHGGAVTIGIRNAERSAGSYDLEVTFDNRIVAVQRSIALAKGESWVSQFALAMGGDDAHTAEARLFRHDDDRVVYRRVWLKSGSREP